MSRRRQPRYVETPDGRFIRRDNAAHEQWLAVHGDTKGGAWLVSRGDDRAEAVFVPKQLLDVGEPCGGFQRMDANLQRLLIPICWCAGPGFIFDEKGLR